jgi:hypothetical protein
VTDRRRSRLPGREGQTKGLDTRLGAGPVATGLTALLAVVGWLGLVRLAIHLGQHARDGGGGSQWALTVLAGAAAAGSLLVALLLTARVRELVVRRGALLRTAGRHRR